MNVQVRLPGTEHWTSKGDVKLFMWNKVAGDPAKTRGTILFVHGSSMASQPTFDLEVPGRPDSSAMEYFARQGYDCWCVDMEGYGRSTKDRDNNAPISFGADDCFAAATYIQKLRGPRPLLVYGISSGALRAGLFAERHPEMVDRLALDATVWTGEGSPTLAERRKKLPEFIAKNRRPIDRAFVHSIFNRDHPGTAEDRVIDAFADAIVKLDGADPHDARPVGRHCGLRRPDRVLQEAAESRQAVRGHAWNFARELPAEELHAGLSHPAELLLTAGTAVQGLAADCEPQRERNR
jgi:pimeloyl-ACP methyl ester carboxylesterase